MNHFKPSTSDFSMENIGDCLILKDTATKEREKPIYIIMPHRRQENFATLKQ